VISVSVCLSALLSASISQSQSDSPGVSTYLTLQRRHKLIRNDSPGEGSNKPVVESDFYDFRVTDRGKEIGIRPSVRLFPPSFLNRLTFELVYGIDCQGH